MEAWIAKKKKKEKKARHMSHVSRQGGASMALGPREEKSSLCPFPLCQFKDIKWTSVLAGGVTMPI